MLEPQMNRAGNVLSPTTAGTFDLPDMDVDKQLKGEGVPLKEDSKGRGG
jgi:hypothetical protein